MIQPRTLTLLTLLVLLGATGAVAVADSFEERVRADLDIGLLELTGSYEAFDPDASLRSVDLASDLGIEGSEATPGVRVALRLGKRHRITLDYLDADDSGSTVAVIPLMVGGIPFDVEADVDATFSLTAARVTYGFAPVVTDTVDVTLTAGLQHLKAEASVTATDRILGIYSITRTDTRSEVGPVVGANLVAHLAGRWELAASADYSTLPLGETDISFVDARFGVGFRVAEIFWVRAGYRIVDTDVDDDDFVLDLSVRGPFLGVTLSK